MVVRDPSVVMGVMAPIGEALNVDVVGLDVPHPGSIRRKLREHEGGLGEVLSELVEPPDRPVQHPVVPSRVGSPDPPGVGEDQELGSIRRPMVVLYRQRATAAPGHQIFSPNQDLPLARGSFIGHDIDAASKRTGWFQRGVPPTIEPASRAKAITVKLGRGKDPLQGQGIFLGSGQTRLKGQNQKEEREERSKAPSSFPRAFVCPLHRYSFHLEFRNLASSAGSPPTAIPGGVLAMAEVAPVSHPSREM